VTQTPSPWQPLYTITSAIARGLMTIEAARAVIAHTPLSPVAKLADVFTAAQNEALQYAEQGIVAEPELIRKLDHRARTVLALFAQYEQITADQIATTLGIAPRTARTLAQSWVNEGWLVILNPSNRRRTYGLSAVYRPFIGCLSASE